MILYIINSILCSALLIASYYLFLEKERAHRFKRWYLMGTLLLSLTIPLITVELEQPQFTSQISTLNEYFPVDIPVAEQAAGTSTELNETAPDFNWVTAILIVYGIVTAILLLRIFNNFLSILSDVNDKTLTSYREATLVVHNKHVIPYSFLSYIFISRQDIDNKQILLHELTHIRQRHSWDVLFVEFIHCLMWFNPVIIFFKKAIRLNHEFLADEVVIKNYPTAEYQTILFQKAQLTSALSLASSFNYSATKKRFIMMTTMKNQTRAFIKITLSCLLLICAALIFPKKIYAQDNPPQINPVPQITPEQNGQGATTQMIMEFDSIIYKYVREDRSKTGKVTRWLNTTSVTDAERTRMREIYNVMTAEQKAKYPVHSHMIFTPFTPPRKNPPTAEEFATYADPKVYGIWLDGKRIANAELAKYQPSDITHVFKSRLLKNAAHYGQYKFHLDLMTQAYFEKTYPPTFK